MKNPAVSRFISSGSGVVGVVGIAFILIPALYAPLAANGRPFYMYDAEGFSMPFLRYIFAPDSPEFLVEQFFNFAAIFIPAALFICFVCKRKFWRLVLCGVFFCALLVPFCTVKSVIDKRDYRELCARPGVRSLFAPVRYGPFEAKSAPRWGATMSGATWRRDCSTERVQVLPSGCFPA